MKWAQVAVGHPGDVVDMTGEQHAMENVTGWPMMRLATLDIDRTYVHWDNNKDKVRWAYMYLCRGTWPPVPCTQSPLCVVGVAVELCTSSTFSRTTPHHP